MLGWLFFIAFLVVIWRIIASVPSSFDKGTAGEQRIHRKLARFEKGGGKILSNIYIPKINGGTTEIDLLLIHPKGLFVFESKNYSGWIFGNENHQNWTQTLPKGWHGDVHKERFYNPILQNSSHIKHVMHHLEKKVPVWSIIVFSDGCELKDITVSSNNVRVIQCRHVAHTIKKICNETQPDHLNEAEIVIIYNNLLDYTNASEEVKAHHSQKAFEAKQRP
jgi:hypothetical protein